MAPSKRDPGPIARPDRGKARPSSAKQIKNGRGRQPAPASAPAFGLDRLVPSIKDPITEAVEATPSDPRIVTTGANDPSEILRRQRLLKANGYDIVADGIWGPRSQKAWTQHTSKGSTAPFKSEKGAATIQVNRNPETPDMIAAARREAEVKAEKVAFEQRVARTAATLERATVLKRNPQAARTMKFREVAEAILDPKAKMGLHTRKGATAFQEWAVANEVPGIAVTGRYDRPTHDVMLREMKREEAEAKMARLRALALRV